MKREREKKLGPTEELSGRSNLKVESLTGGFSPVSFNEVGPQEQTKETGSKESDLPSHKKDGYNCFRYEEERD